MLKLHQPPRAFGLPCPSAFCVKLETYLRMADIPYELENGVPADGPKGKIPWIDDDGHVVGDSSFIIEYLKKKHGDKLDARLMPHQRALGHAIKKVLEESLYLVSSYSKWGEDEGFSIYAAELFSEMPEAQFRPVSEAIRKNVMDKLRAQGIARHTSAEVYELGLEDVRSFAALLGDGVYLFGDHPTSYDACAFGVIGNLKDGPFASPVRDATRQARNVADYIDRMRRKYFPEIEQV
jgi:glutathione S-transferase